MAEHEAIGWKVSVVVPVYNGGKVIGGTIESLLGQSLPPHEIIVVDDGSTDDTGRVVREFGRKVVLLSKPNGGPASARNLGVRAASGEFVAFTDSDCLPHEDWLLNLMPHFTGPSVGGVGGTVKGADPGLVGEYADMVRLLDPGFNQDGEVTYFATANACFRRSVLVEAGLFDERFSKPGGEDVELCIRVRSLGYELCFAEGALVRHHHKRTVLQLLRTVGNYGEGEYRIGRLWPERELKTARLKELVRTTVAVRSMLRTSLGYRARYGLRRSLLFSFLDHYRHTAFMWGYLRGKRMESARPKGLQVSAPARLDDSRIETAREALPVQDSGTQPLPGGQHLPQI